MTVRRAFLAALAILATLASIPSAAAEAPPARDRQSILAMAGDYRVRFDMRETTAFQPDYKPLEPKLSGGHEVVRVIEDRGDFISLQHLLVVEGDGGEPMVVKHWRQDWTWEPNEVVVYDSSGRWKVAAVPPARRDAIRHPVYTWYVGENRHALTPKGWVHEQDNAKVGLRDGQPVTYVHEVVTNTYDRFDGFEVAVADEYWDRTKGYWAQVRAAWDRELRDDGVVRVTEEADAGSVTGPRLMGLADEIAEGKTSVAQAIAEARAVIAGPEKARPLAAQE